MGSASSGALDLQCCACLRYDCGSNLGFIEATVDLGTHRPEVGAEFSAGLQAREAAEEAVM